MKQYLERLVEKSIDVALNAMGCVCLEGPKGCGKSTTAARRAKTIVRLQDPIVFDRYSALAFTSRELLLAGEKPLLFDEWQKIPRLWDFIRAEVDEAGILGQYILTGSARPSEENPESSRHTGTGRIAKITMLPMSLWESHDSSGEVSLKEVFMGNGKINGTSKLSLADLAFVVCRGGWPAAVTHPDQAMVWSNYYFKSLATEDIIDVDGVKRDPKKAQAILRSYARNICTFATSATILGDVIANNETMNRLTLSTYLTAFEKLFVISDIPAWSPKLRSKTIIRSAAKRQFVDPSIATAALEAGPNDLLADLRTFGFLFESLVHRDLRVYAEAIGGKVYHYHDESGLEADAIIHLNNGSWGAIEAKLGGHDFDIAAGKLLKLKDRTLVPPSFLMIISGTEHAYERPDGVLVVPIGCLRD